MNSSSIPVLIIWSRMDQDINSTVLSVNIEKIGIPELKRCTLNISPSNHNWESFSSPIFCWYFDFENITEFDWLIISVILTSIVCTMFTPCISYFIIDIACWSWTTRWNLNNRLDWNSGWIRTGVKLKMRSSNWERQNYGKGKINMWRKEKSLTVLPPE